jgi:hypothetical protein
MADMKITFPNGGKITIDGPADFVGEQTGKILRDAMEQHIAVEMAKGRTRDEIVGEVFAEIERQMPGTLPILKCE